jgi:hypothetical protein
VKNDRRSLVIAINSRIKAGDVVHIRAWPSNIRIVRAYIGVREIIVRDEFKKYHDAPCGFLVNGKHYEGEQE